jgi:hypothetical protein
MKTKFIRFARLFLIAALLVAAPGILPLESSSALTTSALSNLPAIPTAGGVQTLGTDYYAFGFTTPGSGSYSLEAISINLINDGDCAGYFGAELYSDSSGDPGFFLTAFNSIVLPDFYNYYNVSTLSLPTPYALAPSTTYWILAQTGCSNWNPIVGNTSTAPTGTFTYVSSKTGNPNPGVWTTQPLHFIFSLEVHVPEPALSLNPKSLNFGNQVVGAASAPQTVTVTNTGDGNLTIGALSINNDFDLSADTCTNATVAPTGTCTFDVTFQPLSLGYQTGQVSIPSDAASSPDIVDLDGTGVSIPDGNNLLLNPSFDQTPQYPRAWQYSVPRTYFSSLLDCAYFLSPDCSIKLLASRNTSIVTQTVNFNGVGGQQFIFGLSSAAYNIPGGGSYKVEIALFNRYNRVMYTNTLYFSDGAHDWQTLFGTFTAPATFNKMRYRIYFQKSAGYAWFDDAFLIQQP